MIEKRKVRDIRGEQNNSWWCLVKGNCGLHFHKKNVVAAGAEDGSCSLEVSLSHFQILYAVIADQQRHNSTSVTFIHRLDLI